jgi:hypothetical protein
MTAVSEYVFKRWVDFGFGPVAELHHRDSGWDSPVRFDRPSMEERRKNLAGYGIDTSLEDDLLARWPTPATTPLDGMGTKTGTKP